MSLTLVTYITWEHLEGTLPSEEEIRLALRQLDRLNTVVLLSRLNIHLFVDQARPREEKPAALQAFFLARFLPRETILRIVKKFGPVRLDVWRVFHAQQILTLLKWALQECPAEGGARPDIDDSARHELGKCLLKTNDLLIGANQQGKFGRGRKWLSPKGLLELQMHAGSGFEINNPPAIPSSVVRNEIIFSEILDRVKPDFDIKGEFASRSGLELTTYVDMVFGVLAHYLANTHNQLWNDPGLALANPKTFFPNVDAGDLERFWGMEANTLESHAEEARKGSGLPPHQDFVSFRMKPFIKVTETAAICVNPTFVQEKLEAGLFWAIVNTLKEKDRHTMFTSWGHLFEAYSNHLLSTALNPSMETHIPSPQFNDTGDQSFDAVVISGKKCAVIETKGGFLKAESKYSESVDQFLEDLEKKFGTEKGAGIEQLSRKIGQVFARKVAEKRDITGVSQDEVEIVIPILLVQDAFVSSPFVAPWLAKSFRDHMRKKELNRKVIWTGLVVIDIGELEAFRPHIGAGTATFVDAVLRRAEMGDPGTQGRIFTFGDSCNSLLKSKGVLKLPPSDFDDRFEQILNRVSNRFFDRPFERRA